MQYFFFIFLICWVSFAHAGGTKIWESATPKDFQDGEFVNTILTSDNKVKLGESFEATVSNENTLWSYTWDREGKLYLGTGTKGIVYRFEENKLVPHFDTQSLVVTSLVFIEDTLYAATMPEGKIFRIVGGKGELFVTLPSLYIWKLLAFQDKLYAATGPQGILYRIDPTNAKVETVLQTDEKHLLAMDIDAQGFIYVGTSPNGILYRVSPTGDALCLSDFPETEIRAISLSKDKIYVGANMAEGFDTIKVIQTVAQELKQANPRSSDRKQLFAKLMSGCVYEYQNQRGWQRLMKMEKNFVTSLHALPEGGVLCSTGIEGRVYKIENSFKNTVLFDLKDDQVVSLVASGADLKFIGTGDTGTLYRLNKPEIGKSYFYSPIHDSETYSFWGNLTWNKEEEVAIQTRSGNTKKPDRFWSKWSDAQKASSFKIDSPPGRYIQYRIVWQKPEGALISVRILYKPANRPPEISTFKTSIPADNPRKLFMTQSDSVIKVSWKATDPDNDKLCYRLSCSNTETDFWQDLGGGQGFTDSEYKWMTTQIPDGYYIFKIEASDELENAEPLKNIYQSAPILVDNSPPVITISRGKEKIQGSAKDSASPIVQITYRVNGGAWILLDPVDGINDELEERFELKDSIAKNAVVEIKAIDARGNLASTFVR